MPSAPTTEYGSEARTGEGVLGPPSGRDHVPIFNAGSLAASLDVAKLQKDIGIAQYEKAIQSAFREVADGLAARGTYGEELAALERYSAAQQRSLELSAFRYRNGVDNYLTVLTAQTGYYNAQLALAATRLARLTNLVDLYRALGGGWIEKAGDVPRAAADAGPLRVKRAAAVAKRD
jgi:multidrug efflux system outer membrane protein